MREFMTVEICCGSAEDVVIAATAGADRAELCSALFVGGLTPGIGTLRVALDELKRLQDTGILPVRRHTKSGRFEVVAMSRPREGGFCYDQTDYKVSLADAKELLANGADGVVFGYLDERGRVDREKCRAMMEIIGDKTSVFHRAIDVVPDWKEALDILIETGVTRVLTSGCRENVVKGMPTLKEMIAYAEGRIEIQPGGGVRKENVQELIEQTGCTKIHFKKHLERADLSCTGNGEISFNVTSLPNENVYGILDETYVRDVLTTL